MRKRSLTDEQRLTSMPTGRGAKRNKAIHPDKRITPLANWTMCDIDA